MSQEGKETNIRISLIGNIKKDPQFGKTVANFIFIYFLISPNELWNINKLLYITVNR